RRAKLFAQRLKGCRILVVAVNIAEQAAKLVKSCRVHAAVLLQAVPCPGLELVEFPAGLGHADHGHAKPAALHQGLQGGENLFVSQVAGGTEEDQGVRVRFAHGMVTRRGLSRRSRPTPGNAVRSRPRRLPATSSWPADP